MRANFLVQTTLHRKHTAQVSTRSRRTRGGRSGASGRSEDVGRTRVGTGRTPGRTKKDPDYDPAADEGWRVGIPCSARAQRRLNGGGGRWPRRRPDSADEADDDDDLGEDDDIDIQNRNDEEKKEEWVAEESLNLWEIRNFVDT